MALWDVERAGGFVSVLLVLLPADSEGVTFGKLMIWKRWRGREIE